MMKRILITGANSYIGTSFEKYMEQWSDKYKIDTIDTKGNDWLKCDFFGYDVIFHVAGIAHQKETLENAHLYYEVNRDLSTAVANKAKKEGVKQFILLSSMSVYGKNEGIISKKTVPHPNTHYGKSKFQADRKISKLSCDSFKVTILRPPMVYGKNCKGNYQRLRSFALKSPIFPDFPNKRSMIFIGNLCEFVKECIDYEKRGLFLPQNSNYVNTCDMVCEIAKSNNKKVKRISAFNFGIKLIRINLITKVFGSLIYEKSDIISKYSFEESIRISEL